MPHLIRPAFCRIAIPCLMALALAGCGDKTAPDKTAAAGGQVLPGSASDAMLPQDTVRSQPPLAKPTGDGDGEAKGDSGKADRATAETPKPDKPKPDRPKPDRPKPDEAN